MEREDKMKMICSPEQLAEIFRSMAEALKRGRLSLDTLEVGWNEVEKIALTVHNAAGMADVKIRIISSDRVVDLPGAEEDVHALDPDLQPRAPSPGIDRGSPVMEVMPRGSYNSLKKRMKNTFKNIIYALHENTWPSQIDIEAFLRDSAEMVRYPGKGDEFYPSYTEAVAVFADAVQRKDMEAAYQAAHLLNTLKTRCHKKYD